MIKYRKNAAVSSELLAQLFSESGWVSGEYPLRLFGAVHGAEFSVSAWDGETLAGIATAISDGSINVFVPYLIVARKYRKRGIGHAFIGEIISRYGDCMRLTLFCSENNIGFYESCGFCRMDGQSVMSLEKFGEAE